MKCAADRKGRRHGVEVRRLADVALDRCPDEEDLATTKRPDVVHSFKQDAVLQTFSNRAHVVLDASGQLFGGEKFRGHVGSLSLVNPCETGIAHRKK